MATEAGIISALIGTATATAVDGTVRNLQVGDRVYPNEIITTGLAGAIEIEFPDGSVMDLGRNSQAVLDSETFELDVADAETPTPAADVVDEIEAIQQALLAGEDPTQFADATAAGPGALPTSEGGSDAVVVDYLAPRITPDSGFETTGPGITFLDPPPFDFLVDESDDLDSVDPDPITPPPVDNTPPVADPVLTSYSFASQAQESLPEGAYVYKHFTVGGGVDESEFGLKSPTIFEVNPSLGGDDGPDGTPESLLTFTLTADPSFGTLYKLVEGEWVALKAGEEGNNTFNVGDSILWIATQEEFAANITTITNTYGGVEADSSAWNKNGVTVTATKDGTTPGNIAYDKDGIGVFGGTIVPRQLEYRDGVSESISIHFANPSTDAEITVSRLIGKEFEVGRVEAKLNGESLGSWTFTTANGQTFLDGVAIDFNPTNMTDVNGATGTATFIIEGIIFDELIFTATPYADGAPTLTAGDSSDYYIQSVSVKEVTGMPGTSFEYTVTDESNNVSAPVEVVISAGNDTVVGNEQDNIISGGPGDDILTGGAGKDIFVWNAGDEGVAGAPAMDIVTDFNIADGDVLDFSDILIGEESGNLTDFISITEDGSDIVIELKPTAEDVTQIVTLQGKSLADLGLGGFDTSTQQAEMINKLVQEGHVNVDS